MRSMLWAGAVAILAGCSPEAAVEGDCEVICQELVYDCDYAAFPSFDSCVQGCTHNSSEGADIVGQRACIEEAACDTFAIVECEHAYGLE